MDTEDRVYTCCSTYCTTDNRAAVNRLLLCGTVVKDAAWLVTSVSTGEGVRENGALYFATEDRFYVCWQLAADTGGQVSQKYGKCFQPLTQAFDIFGSVGAVKNNGVPCRMEAAVCGGDRGFGHSEIFSSNN
jgi:hypothetical protein